MTIFNGACYFSLLFVLCPDSTLAWNRSIDHALPPIIGPVTSYATYSGGTSDEVAYATATDASGNSYTAGYTTSTNFPTTTGAYATANQNGTSKIFISKFSPTGKLVYSTYIGGSGDDVAYGLAVDSSGNAYMTGSTTSADFPVTTGAYKSTYQGGASDAFLVKLNAAGNTLLYSTYLGGSGADVGNGIALDSSNEATITGSTASTDLPVSGGACQPAYGGGITDAFVTRLNAAGTALAYSTYLGGVGEDVGYGVALDSHGNAYVTGYTQSANFPTTTGVAQSTTGGDYDAFVTALNPTGTALLYSTFLGGSDQDYGVGIAVDSGANAYVTGYTASPDYPHTSGAFQSAKAGGYDAVVTKLTPSGTLAYSIFLGGSGDDFGQAIAVDSSGNAYVTGETASADFPAIAPIQAGLDGAVDAFVTSVNATGTALNYSTWLGGSGFETGYGVALDSARTAYIAGYTTSGDFPVTAGAAQSTLAGGSDAFLVKLAASPLLTIAKSHTGNFNQGQAGAIYSISVSNTGLAPTSGAVTVVDTLPAGLTATGISGSGWTTCTLATLTCTRSDTLNGGASFAPITVTVSVSANAAAQVTNQASISGGGAGNATTNDITTIGVTAASQTITFGSLGNVTFGVSPFTITASASSGLAVSFVSTTSPVCTVSGNTVTVFAAGVCSITAGQAGNPSWQAATNVIQSFTVASVSQTITFGPLSGQTTGSTPPALVATASSGLAVSFSSNSAPVCIVSGTVVTLLAPGTCSITASQGGNGGYAAAIPVTQTFPVINVLLQDTFATPGNTPDRTKWTTVTGQPSYLGRTQLADWISPGSTGTFPVGSGAAQLTLNTYNPTGSSLYGTQGQTIAWFQPTVNAVIEFSSKLQLTSLQPGIVYGTYFYGCAPSSCANHHDELDIEILTNSLQQGSPFQVELNRYAAEPLGAGHGSLVNLPSGFDPLAVHTWTTRWSLSEIDYLVDGTLLLSATDHVPQGPMQAEVIAWGPDSTWPQAYSSSLTQAVNASQNQAYTARLTSVIVAQTQGSPLLQAITFGALGNVSLAPGPLEMAATATSGLPVTFISATPAVCTASGAAVTLVAVGTCSITATQAGSAGYAPAAAVTQSFVVAQATQTCDINADGATNVADVQLIINEALGVSPPLHDLNHDGSVNVADVQIVINAALGLGCSAQ